MIRTRINHAKVSSNHHPLNALKESPSGRCPRVPAVVAWTMPPAFGNCMWSRIEKTEAGRLLIRSYPIIGRELRS